ncbi:MAG: O-antigen ligase domain-containing protein [Nitrospirae bacterium]|nr:MAG: O-antigen ligase domain-containing protein [Nitrospirota bacterium]
MIKNFIRQARAEPGQISYYSCLLLGLSYPWSIAASTALLAICGILGLVFSRREDLEKIWLHHKLIIISISIYLGYFLLSICWSIDPDEGLVRIARKWAWIFLLPLAMLLMRTHDARNGLFVGITAGLGSHLILCFIQWSQIIPIGHTIFWGTVHLPLPSTAEDPTGLLDHIHFGIIHGIYAALVFHRLLSGEKIHLLSLLVAILGIMFSFLSQGRTGYIIIVALLLLVTIMDIRLLKKKTILLLSACAVIVAISVALSPKTQTRIHHIASDPQRMLIWSVALDIWRDSPWFGMGAGGYNRAKVEQIRRSPEYHIKNPAFGHDHPHSIYLWHLTTGGILGLLSLLLLFGSLLWSGTLYWKTGGANIAVAGVALIIHGAFNDSLEQHFPLFAAIIALAIGFAETSSGSSTFTEKSSDKSNGPRTI